MKTLRCMPAAALAGGLASRSKAAKHSHRTAQPSPTLTGCAGRQLEAALLRPQADAILRKRGVKEERDGRDASDVDGAVEAGEDALEELPGEVEQAGGKDRWGQKENPGQDENSQIASGKVR